ncbi:MAG: AarF/UbiB family protein, partial [Armatimonadota bacterium]|nr:AarF/UbiB family protein [Armatimonadota bacterium]
MVYRRYVQVLGAFVRYIFVVTGIRLRHRVSCWLGHPTPESLEPQYIRRVLQDLGATFVKFGQILAMRPDLLPPVYIDELSGLLDSAPTFDSSLAVAIIEEELGHSLCDLFPYFEMAPLAAASFGQVHKAQLKTGEWVAVKVQRPGLKPLIDADLRLVRLITTVVDLSGVMYRVRLKSLVDDFESWTYEEIDYTQEASYAERLCRECAGEPTVCIPQVYWDYTTSKVLTAELMQGVWVSEILQAIEARDEGTLTRWQEEGMDLKVVAHNIFQNSMEQVYERSLFHADPHAGNLLVLSDNRIGYVDFGIVGQMGKEMRAIELSLLNCLGTGDLDRFFRSFLQLGDPPSEDIDLADLEKRIKHNVRQWQNATYNPHASLKTRSASQMVMLNLGTAREFGLSFQEVTVRYYRVLTVAEMMILRLDPTFNLVHAIRAFVTRLRLRALFNDLSPQVSLENWLQTQYFLRNMPQTASDMVRNFSDDRRTVLAAVSRTRKTFARVVHT